jgi:hypothetical protein
MVLLYQIQSSLPPFLPFACGCRPSTIEKREGENLKAWIRLIARYACVSILPILNKGNEKP